MPASAIRRIRIERRASLEEARKKGELLSPSEQKRIRRLFSKRVEDYLDRGLGACCLANPSFAGVVAGALRHFDGIRYKLHAWCVMPNHVHVVFLPLDGFSLSEIVHSWKSFSAQRINSSSATRGTLWQREYYDHLIRDGEQFSRAVRYVAENPERAGLKNWKWVEVCPQD